MKFAVDVMNCTASSATTSFDPLSVKIGWRTWATAVSMKMKNEDPLDICNFILLKRQNLWSVHRKFVKPWDLVAIINHARFGLVSGWRRLFSSAAPWKTLFSIESLHHLYSRVLPALRASYRVRLNNCFAPASLVLIRRAQPKMRRLFDAKLNFTGWLSTSFALSVSDPRCVRVTEFASHTVNHI